MFECVTDGAVWRPQPQLFDFSGGRRRAKNLKISKAAPQETRPKLLIPNALRKKQFLRLHCENGVEMFISIASVCIASILMKMMASWTRVMFSESAPYP